MIKTLIFDFGDVFINLDKEGALQYALEQFKIDHLDEELLSINALYEQGLIDTDEFLDFYQENFPHLNEDQLKHIWNYIIKDFPEHRLSFIQQLANKKEYQLILLSNTNALHIDHIKTNVPFYEDFKNCFDQFYLSHEVNLRKPEASIFNFVLEENNLNPKTCLFVDDTLENIKTAEKLGINVWNNNPKTEDIVNLFSIKKDLF